MSRRMASETIIFDTEWLTEADFGSESSVLVRIDCHAYDTLKIIVDVPGVVLYKGRFFQEFEVYKLKNIGPNYKLLLAENNDGFIIDYNSFTLDFYLDKHFWENNIKGLGSIYIKGVKR